MKCVLLGAALLGLAGAASAQGVADRVAPHLHAQGFTRFEVNQGPAPVGVGGVRGRERVEPVRSLVTSEVPSHEVRLVDGDADRTPRLDFDRSNGGVVDAGGGRGDDGGEDGRRGGEDRNRGHGNDEDGFDGGNPGRGHGDEGRRGGGHGRGRR